MGNVISISRVSDLDIFSEFDAQCPSIPVGIDNAIQQNARNVTNKTQTPDKSGSFRVVCAAVALGSIIAVAAVNIVTDQVRVAISTDNFSSDSSIDAKKWRESPELWQAYIAQLEASPLVVHLQTEKKLFQQKHP